MASIKNSAESAWYKCQSAQELKDLQKERSQLRKPLTELLASVKTGINELKKAIVAYDQRLSTAKRASAGGNAGPKRKKAKGSAPSMMEKALEKGIQIPVHSVGSGIKDMAIDFNQPAILRLDGEVVKNLLAEAWGCGLFSLFVFCVANTVLVVNDK